jgi:hypothetical protein
MLELEDPDLSVERLLSGLREEGVLMVGFGPRRIRAVTHLDVDDGGIERGLEALDRVLRHRA